MEAYSSPSSTLQRNDHSSSPVLETISHAICTIDLPESIPPGLQPADLASYVYEHATIGSCNRIFWEEALELDSSPSSNDVVASHFEPLFRDILITFFESDRGVLETRYRRNREDGSQQHFDMWLHEHDVEGHLRKIWVGLEDVSETVDLEKKIVAALEKQQESFARELHDSLGQLLTSIRMLSENLVDRTDSEHDDQREIAKKIQQFASEAATEISKLENGLLAPEELSDDGLLQALSKIAYTTDSIPGISATFRSDPDVHIEDTRAGLQLYRIAQEAVNNAVRHAAPDSIEIALTRNDRVVELTVSDDGTGFDVKKPDVKGLGLNSMYYRANLIGGDLDIVSRAGSGTTVRCVLSKPHSTS